MSGVVKAVGKFIGGVADAVGDVVSAAGKFLKKAWPIIAVAAVTYFTMGAGTAAAAGAAGGSTAAGTAAGTAAATMGPAAGGIGATTGAAGASAAAGGAAGVAASGGVGQAVASPLASSGKIVGTSLNSGMTQAGATQALTSNAAYTGNAGAISDTVAKTVQLGQGAKPSQVSQTVKSSMGGTSQAGGSEITQRSLAQQGNSLFDSFESNIPGMTGGEAELSGVDLLKSKFSGMGDWMKKHPYLTMMGAQTLSNLGQPSEMDLLEKSQERPGAFFGMERDGTTVNGKTNVTGYAPGTEPDPSILSRARAAAGEQAPTINPIDPNVRPKGVVQPNITQLDPTRGRV